SGHPGPGWCSSRRTPRSGSPRRPAGSWSSTAAWPSARCRRSRCIRPCTSWGVDPPVRRVQRDGSAGWQRAVSDLLPMCERTVNRRGPGCGAARGGPTIPPMESSERQRDYVLRTVEERGVRMIRLWFTDVLGQLKSFAISPVELEGAFEEGMRFDGSSIAGYSRVKESHVLARPDTNSFEILPWADGVGTSSRVLSDISNLDGSPPEGNPPLVHACRPEQALASVLVVTGATDVEFVYCADGDPSKRPEPLDQASYFDLTTADVATGLRQRTIPTLEAVGIPGEYSHHEDATS